MARGLKTAGMEELKKFRQRVLRQHSMERISKEDRDYILELVNKIEAKIVYMPEGIDDWLYEQEV